MTDFVCDFKFTKKILEEVCKCYMYEGKIRADTEYKYNTTDGLNL